MKDQTKQIDPTEKFQEATREYLAGIREYFTGVEQKIAEASKVLDMREPIHARSMHSLISSLTWDIERDVKKLGSEYEGNVRTLRHIVTHEY